MKVLYLLFIILLVVNAKCQYNKQWSYELNRISAATHCTQEQIVNWNCKICKDGQKLLSVIYMYNKFTNILGFAGYLPSKNYIIFSMRGTKDIKNWLSNFSYKQIKYSPCPDCLIHEGFYLDYFSISQKISAAYKSLLQKYPQARILFVGSSLGGSLATIAGLQVQLQTGRVDQLHVFGCPRVGNQKYAQFITSKIKTIYRVVHNKDIVPHVPLQSQNFQHPAYQILFDQEMDTYKICDSTGEDAKCSDAYYPNFSVSDHTSYWFKPVEQDQCTP